jgi:hypothetical protein
MKGESRTYNEVVIDLRFNDKMHDQHREILMNMLAEHKGNLVRIQMISAGIE